VRRPRRDARALARWIVGASAVAAITVRAGASPIGPDSPHPTPRNTAVAGKPAPLDPPRLALSIDPVDETGWVVRLDNMDSVPIRILEDWRLISLDVTPPTLPHGKVAVQHCVLPGDMRPTDDDRHQIVLAPGRAYATFIDPRVFCFNGAPARALVPGASVVAHVGFSPDRKNPDGPPLFAVPLDPSSSRGPSKEIVSEPFTVPEYAPHAGTGDADSGTTPGVATTAQAGGSLSEAPPDDTLEPSALTVTTTPTVDVDNIRDLTLRITVTNGSRRKVRLLLSPHTVAIDATNHFGTTFPCHWELPPTPIGDLFITIPPMGHASTDVLVQDICPPMFLAWPGLYTLRASVDTRKISSESIGLPFYVGKVTAAQPTLVRIHSQMRGGVR
jgi:hypothetical protein